jgi:cellulose synthase/poly-beta-1,6-N-acetylglucosamine synthase-like glycosyltransferase
VRVLNGCTVKHGTIRNIHLPQKSIELLQVIEYLRAFLIGREGWAKLDMLPIISGAFGLFNTKLLREIGGMSADSTAEDLDLVVRMHRAMLDSGKKYRIAFVPDPTCWTKVPTDVRSLGSQRCRWQRGLWDVLWRYRNMLFRPRYGRIGFVLLPYLWIFEAFEPLIELTGYICIILAFILGNTDMRFAVEVLLLGYGFSALVSIGSIGLEEMTYRRYQTFKEVLTLIGYRLLRKCDWISN